MTLLIIKNFCQKIGVDEVEWNIEKYEAIKGKRYAL